MKWLPLIALGLLIALAPRARGAVQATLTPLSDQQQSDLCAAAVQKAEQQYGTPPGLLNAIAKAESGRRIVGAPTLQAWPWTINVDGEGLFFPSKEQAVAWTRKELARGASFIDVGCMQVDLQFHPHAFRSLEDAFDPTANADYAARFLLSLLALTGGNWFIATGFYHSQTPYLARMYRERITAVSFNLVPALMAGSAKLRLALAGGGTAVINVHRQPARRQREVNACRVAMILGPYLRSSARAQACGVSDGAHQPRGPA